MAPMMSRRLTLLQEALDQSTSRVKGGAANIDQELYLSESGSRPRGLGGACISEEENFLVNHLS
jgi:hypothetical protein